MQAHEIIRLLGGATAVASALGIKRSAVSMWGSAGIPAKYWLSLVRLADSKTGVVLTLENLEHHRRRGEADGSPNIPDTDPTPMPVTSSAYLLERHLGGEKPPRQFERTTAKVLERQGMADGAGHLTEAGHGQADALRRTDAPLVPRVS